jgi:hypothetical protein
MKKIGFIDFFLDEWHANNYPQWIRENCIIKGRDWEVSYAFAETEKAGGLDTYAWCKKHGLEQLSTIEELVERSDYIIVLSPDNPEIHERLSRIPLISGKPVYIDKTFSPDLLSAARMFELADKYSTPMFSSSALRFARELSGYPNNVVNLQTLEYVAAMGPGSFENYSVHQFEIIVSMLGTGSSRLKSLSTNNSRHLIVEYKDGRHASMLQMEQAPFQVALQLKDGRGVFVSQCSDIFPRLINAILDFFETGNLPVEKEETLEIMALIEAGRKALKNYDTWIDVEKL